jgi:hypothetical protein
VETRCSRIAPDLEITQTSAGLYKASLTAPSELQPTFECGLAIVGKLTRVSCFLGEGDTRTSRSSLMKRFTKRPSI